MPVEDNNQFSYRKPLAAFLLSLPVAGLGHLYCGKLNKGMALFFLSFAFVPVILVTVMTVNSSPVFALVTVGTIIFRIVLSMYAVIDATLLARRMRDPYKLKEYNRWYVYLLLIAVSMFGSLNLDMDIRHNIIQAFKVPSTSMVPNIFPHDQLWADKAVYGMQPVKVGDVVIFIYPNNRSVYFLKRIIALPGDTVEIRDNIVYINDQPLRYSKIKEDRLQLNSPLVKGPVLYEKNRGAEYKIMITSHDAKTANFTKTKVPNGYCFVLGDNRNNSRDSRFFGPVPLADVLGRVDFIYWPALNWERFGRYKD